LLLFCNLKTGIFNIVWEMFRVYPMLYYDYKVLSGMGKAIFIEYLLSFGPVYETGPLFIFALK